MSDVNYSINPFPGIRSFEPDEDYLFFGRDRQISNVLDMLCRTHFIALIGYSGSGKSSLIKAGIIPGIAKGKMPVGYSNEWNSLLFRPGDDPFLSFATALVNTVTENYDGDEADMANIALDLQKAKDLKSVYQQFDKGQGKNWLIVIDQFEELFRLRKKTSEGEDISDTQKFLNLVLSGLDDHDLHIYIIFSMRSDFLDNTTEFAGLPEAFNRGSYLLPKTTKSEIREIIEKPIAVCNAKISESLVELLMADMNENLDQLPVLQHALMRTWNYWRQNTVGEDTISVSHYQAIGSMATALSIHAEEIYHSFPTEKLKVITEKVFKALTDVTLDNKGTRRPVPISELVELSNANEHDVVEVINEFRAPGRAFLMPNYKFPLHSDTIVDITHESIMRVWERLKDWVQEESKSAELYLRLSKSAERYQYGETGLWINPDLALAAQWQQEQKPNISWAARYNPYFDRTINFLDYSKKQAAIEIEQKESKQKRELRRARNSVLILAGASVISLLLFMYSYNEGVKATASEKQAKENEKNAKLASIQAIEQRKEAVLQSRIASQQQQITVEEKLITEAQKSNALKQQQIAEAQTVEAVSQRQKAESAEHQAVSARKDVEVQKNRAINEAQNAIQQKSVAEDQRKKAETSEQKAQGLRLISIARTIAIESAKSAGAAGDDVPALLALQAYNFNRDNGGVANDKDIFNALSLVSDRRPILRGHNDAVRGVDLSTDGKILVSCSDDATVRVWTANTTGSFVFSRSLSLGEAKGKEVRSVAISNDGTHVAAGTVDGRLLYWNINQKDAKPTIVKAHLTIINKVCFNASKNNLVTAGSDGFIKVWNPGNFAVPVSMHDVHSPVLSMACADNGGKLACGTKAGSIFVFNVNSLDGAPVNTFTRDGRAISSLAFNAAGNMLASGNSAAIVSVYDLKNKGKQSDFTGHTSAVNAISFSSDNKTFATCSYDKTIRIWTIASPGQNPIVISDYDGWVMDLAYSPGGKRIISGGADRSVRVFNVNQQEMAAAICDKVKRNLTNDEWINYIGKDIPRQKTCADKP